jgi:hypothetical protein
VCDPVALRRLCCNARFRAANCANLSCACLRFARAKTRRKFVHFFTVCVFVFQTVNYEDLQQNAQKTLKKLFRLIDGDAHSEREIKLTEFTVKHTGVLVLMLWGGGEGGGGVCAHTHHTMYRTHYSLLSFRRKFARNDCKLCTNFRLISIV